MDQAFERLILLLGRVGFFGASLRRGGGGGGAAAGRRRSRWQLGRTFGCGRRLGDRGAGPERLRALRSKRAAGKSS